MIINLLTLTENPEILKGFKSNSLSKEDMAKVSKLLMQLGQLATEYPELFELDDIEDAVEDSEIDKI